MAEKVVLYRRPDVPVPVHKIVEGAQPVGSTDRVDTIRKQLQATFRQAADRAFGLVRKMGDPLATREERVAAEAEAYKLLKNEHTYAAFSARERGQVWAGIEVKKNEPSDAELRSSIKKIVAKRDLDAIDHGFNCPGGDRLVKIYNEMQFAGELSPPQT